jgi:hypothetical protein
VPREALMRMLPGFMAAISAAPIIHWWTAARAHAG